MLGMTHQIVALTTALWILIQYPVALGWGGGLLAIMAVMLGAITPDLDQPTADIWQRFIGGRLVHRLFTVFSGGHRHFTHALVGIAAIGGGTHYLITHLLAPSYIPDGLILWQAFMIGYISHSVADTLTDQGVPWLWPLPWNIKIPPGHKALRVTTGSLVERFLIRGALIIAAVLLLSRHYAALPHLFSK